MISSRGFLVREAPALAGERTVRTAARPQCIATAELRWKAKCESPAMLKPGWRAAPVTRGACGPLAGTDSPFCCRVVPPSADAHAHLLVAALGAVLLPALLVLLGVREQRAHLRDTPSPPSLPPSLPRIVCGAVKCTKCGAPRTAERVATAPRSVATGRWHTCATRCGASLACAKPSAIAGAGTGSGPAAGSRSRPSPTLRSSAARRGGGAANAALTGATGKRSAGCGCVGLGGLLCGGAAADATACCSASMRAEILACGRADGWGYSR